MLKLFHFNFFRFKMDSDRVGSKFGGGGVASSSEQATDRRERLRKLALETIDLKLVRSSFFQQSRSIKCIG